MYLEENYPNSAVTKKAQEIYPRLGTNSQANYEFLLGSIKGIKEFEDENEQIFEI